MEFSREQITDALIGEWLRYEEDGCCEDDFFSTIEDYKTYLNGLSDEELVEETSTGEGFTLSEFIYAYS